jgi:glycosyltransferase involved in cell wall biosynthesis
VKKRVLIVQPQLVKGGARSVTAWAMQALRDTCDLTLLTWKPVDFEAINRVFGTSLRPSDARVHLMPAVIDRLLGLAPTSAELFRSGVLQRACQSLLRHEEFDICISNNNEMDFGRRGIQYVNYPSELRERPKNELRWYHVHSAVSLYRGFCRRFAGTSLARLRSNLTLSNSDFIAGLVREAHGIESVTLHPPVPDDFPAVGWDDREDAVVAIGRFTPEKRWEDAVEIVRRLRESGRPLRLTLIGQPDHAVYDQAVYALAKQYPWFRVETNLPRERVVQVVARHRYAIHTMHREHFGIAPAEMQMAGCLTFVHRSGGPMEIVGHQEAQMFDDVGDAVRKLTAVMDSAQLQSELRERAAARSRRFTSEEFMRRLRRIVEEFVSSG